MYSSRRRSHRYQSKKYYRNNLFAPSLLKANAPNYYQMKGRIIQQSPSRIKNADTELITMDKLKKMYQTLITYKYPIPSAPPINPDSFFYHFNTSSKGLISLGTEYVFTSDNILTDYVSYVLSQLPPPPDEYHYVFNVTYITFNHGLFATTDTSRFNFNWDASILQAQQLALISKTQDSAISGQVQLPVLAISTGSANQMRVARIGFAASSINLTFSVQNTTDQVTTDDGFYPLITNDVNSEIYGATISYSSETQSSPSYAMLSIQFGIDILLKTDFV